MCRKIRKQKVEVEWNERCDVLKELRQLQHLFWATRGLDFSGSLTWSVPLKLELEVLESSVLRPYSVQYGGQSGLLMFFPVL